eukprot:scaffold12513_cov103-Skeletonema_dohrnii-CCMP3373.AAC.7
MSETPWYIIPTLVMQMAEKDFTLSLLGEDCCAPDSVSFHYIKEASMVRHMHALINSCDDTAE